MYREQLRTVDSSPWQTIQQGNIPTQHSNDDLKVSPKSPLEDVERDGRVAPPATPVTLPSFRISSTIEHRLHESEWLKAVSDQEREFLQRERRRMNAYKTSLCNSFRDTGRCPYGSQCRFAHGVNELLPVPRPHPKYKTQLCNKFALYGSCPYGSRCQFIHMRPCKPQNNLGYMNFAASFDGGSMHALHYQHCAMCRRPRFCGRNTCIVDMPGSLHYCNSFPQQFFDNNLQRNITIPMSCNYNIERTSDIPSLIDSNRLNFNVTTMDDLNDLFGTMNIGESSNPFTQSCFPRINMENYTGTNATVSHVSGNDTSYHIS